MNAKERVRAILEGRPADRIPVDIWHTPEVYAALSAHFGTEDDLALYRAMDLDKIVWLGIEYKGTGEDGEETRAGSSHYVGARSAWGVPLKEIDTGTAVYHEMAEAPLAAYDTPESLDDYPYWPDPDRFDYDGLTAQAQRASAEYVVNAPWVSFYEIYCQMRGLENAMTDLLALPDLVDAVLDRVEAIQTALMKRLFDQAADYLDLTFISDDMGGQNALLMSLDMWDRYFKDRMKRWCDLIHGYGLKVFYHSDGACGELAPRLLEAGIDVLNPIQHVCPGMDMAGLKDNYGDRLVFHGGVDNQHALPFGTVEEVRAETRHCLDTLGRDGAGYICCSCHNIQAGTPVENILAMIDTVKTHRA